MTEDQSVERDLIAGAVPLSIMSIFYTCASDGKVQEVQKPLRERSGVRQEGLEERWGLG